MLLLTAALFVAASASPQPARDMPIINPKASQPATCPATSRYEASKRGKAPRAEKLNELPDADLYRSVYRHIGRCEVPMIVKFGVSDR